MLRDEQAHRPLCAPEILGQADVSKHKQESIEDRMIAWVSDRNDMDPAFTAAEVASVTSSSPLCHPD